MSQQDGRARVEIGENNTLTEHNGEAVVTLDGQGEWKIKYVGEPKSSSPTVMFIFHKEGDKSPDLAMTLSNEPSGDYTNILVQGLDSPPSDRQLWTLEEIIVQHREPPIVHARIQSVADPERSAAVAGDVALPKLYLNVAAVPNEPGSDTQKWRLDYLEME